MGMTLATESTQIPRWAMLADAINRGKQSLVKGEHCDLTTQHTKVIPAHPKLLQELTVECHKSGLSPPTSQGEGKGGKMVNQSTHQILPSEVSTGMGETPHAPLISNLLNTIQ